MQEAAAVSAGLGQANADNTADTGDTYRTLGTDKGDSGLPK
jgi:hypothetical protein